jgi:hypothetical protein
VNATVHRGLQRETEAILFVEGVDRDEIGRRGRVLMRREDGGWRYATSDLSRPNAIEAA